jgi:hypothetical protein
MMHVPRRQPLAGAIRTSAQSDNPGGWTMTVYRRRADSDDAWHWRPECTSYPTEQPLVAMYVRAGRPRSGMLCPECLRLEEEAGGRLDVDGQAAD